MKHPHVCPKDAFVQVVWAIDEIESFTLEELIQAERAAGRSLALGQAAIAVAFLVERGQVIRFGDRSRFVGTFDDAMCEFNALHQEPRTVALARETLAALRPSASPAELDSAAVRLARDLAT